MHFIRLRQPWRKCAQGSTVTTRIDVPEPVVAESSDDGQTFCYRRSFNLPSGLQTSSRIHLRVDGWEGHLESATLNGSVVAMGPGAKIDAEITELLMSHNEIELCLTNLNGQVARLSGEVALAIEETND